MKNKKIISAVLGLVFTLGIYTVAHADTMDMKEGTKKSVNGVNVELSFNKDNKAQTGKNDVMITLHDSNDKEIDDANVKLSAEMDKSSDMNMDMDKSKPIKVTLDNNKQGEYMGTINFTDKGKWIVTTNVVVNGEKNSIQFDVNVANGGPNWIVIGGFIGVVALIIIVAVVNKKQSSRKVIGEK